MCDSKASLKESRKIKTETTRMNPEEISKIIAYEVYFAQQSQQNLVKMAKRIIDEANAAIRNLDDLAATLKEHHPVEDWKIGEGT